jgi:hypothetical protein
MDLAALLPGKAATVAFRSRRVPGEPGTLTSLQRIASQAKCLQAD